MITIIIMDDVADAVDAVDEQRDNNIVFGNEFKF